MWQRRLATVRNGSDRWRRRGHRTPKARRRAWPRHPQAPPGAVPLEPPLGEDRIIDGTVSFQPDQRNPAADGNRPVLGSMLGDENLMPVGFGKHVTGIKFHAQGGYMGTQVDGRCLKLAAGLSGAIIGIPYPPGVDEFLFALAPANTPAAPATTEP